MRRIIFLIAGTLALAGAAPATPADPAATVTVLINATGFQPEEVVIREGDTVTWRNSDKRDHQVISDSGAFRSPVLDPGETFSFRFETPSAYSYHDGLQPSDSGLVHVRGSGNSVTIGVTRLWVVYGNAVRVAGSVANGQAGESVSVTITRYGGQQQTRVLTTDADGTWQFEDRPRIRTEYKATWRNGNSNQAPFVSVRPLVSFRVLSARANRFYVRVRAQRSYAGRTVLIQRRNTSRDWVTKKRVRLNRRGEAFFRGSFVRGRTHARAFVRSAPGYLAGFSTTRTIIR
jgi:plastocyanin